MISTVVGNFPKVGDSHAQQELRRAIEAHQQGKIKAEELARVEDQVTTHVINLQIEAGIGLITDGQIRWSDPLTWPVRKLKGITISGLLRFFDNNVYYRQPIVTSGVGWQEPLVVEDFLFAKKAAGGRAQVKAVLPGPYSLARLSKNNHYGRLEDLVGDFAKALAQEVQALVKAGASFIQLDEPSLPYFPEHFPMAAKGLEIVLAQASPAKTALYTYFSGISKTFSDLMSLPVDVLGIDLVSDPENVKLLQNNKSTKDLSLGIVDARNTKMEQEEKLHSLLNSLEKNRERIAYLNPSAGLEFLPYDVAVKKLHLVAKLTGPVKQPA